MKDQRALATKCLMNDIPFFTLCGNDICSLKVIKYYYQVAKESGTNQEFLDDLEELIDSFRDFHETEPERLKIPD